MTPEEIAEAREWIRHFQSESADTANVFALRALGNAAIHRLECALNALEELMKQPESVQAEVTFKNVHATEPPQPEFDREAIEQWIRCVSIIHTAREKCVPYAEASGFIKSALAHIDRLESRFRTPIVCMCGSTRFKQSWITENARLTGEGQIVLSVGLWGHHERKFPSPELKVKLDDLHKRKIDLCDWVWVLDVGGYIGDSTRSEIEYANKLGKPIRYLSQEFPGYMEPESEFVQQLAAKDAEIERLNREREESIENSVSRFMQSDALRLIAQQDNEKLRSENEALRKDAERYQLTRTERGLSEILHAAENLWPGEIQSLSNVKGADWDQAIDAAIAAREGT